MKNIVRLLLGIVNLNNAKYLKNDKQMINASSMTS